MKCDLNIFFVVEEMLVYFSNCCFTWSRGCKRAAIMILKISKGRNKIEQLLRLSRNGPTQQGPEPAPRCLASPQHEEFQAAPFSKRGPNYSKRQREEDNSLTLI